MSAGGGTWVPPEKGQEGLGYSDIEGVCFNLGAVYHYYMLRGQEKLPSYGVSKWIRSMVSDDLPYTEMEGK
jgi:hypothetical protein